MTQSAIQPVSTTRSTYAVNAPRDARRLTTAQRLGRQLDIQDPATARMAATQMVSELFFKPLLAELRASSMGAPFLDGGQTESVFGEQLDQKLADTVAGRQTGLVSEIAAKLSHGKAAQ